MIDVVEVIHELTDEDAGDEMEEEEGQEGQREEAMKVLMEGLVGLYLHGPFSCRTDCFV